MPLETQMSTPRGERVHCFKEANAMANAQAAPDTQQTTHLTGTLALHSEVRTLT